MFQLQALFYFYLFFFLSDALLQAYLIHIYSKTSVSFGFHLSFFTEFWLARLNCIAPALRLCLILFLPIFRIPFISFFPSSASSTPLLVSLTDSLVLFLIAPPIDSLSPSSAALEFKQVLTRTSSVPSTPSFSRLVQPQLMVPIFIICSSSADSMLKGIYSVWGKAAVHSEAGNLGSMWVRSCEQRTGVRRREGLRLSLLLMEASA